ncbi:hypothetical protein MMC13_007185 [Lambiella insularis]|nr:hypothetical protein [Lambiella insularis]
MNVALFKKESKNVGQAELVKLLPKLVSNGFGNGAFVGTLEAIIKDEDVVKVEDIKGEKVAELAVDGGSGKAVEEAAVAELSNAVAVVDATRLPPCRGKKRSSLRRTRGMGRRSMIISPL